MNSIDEVLRYLADKSPSAIIVVYTPDSTTVIGKVTKSNKPEAKPTVKLNTNIDEVYKAKTVTPEGKRDRKNNHVYTAEENSYIQTSKDSLRTKAIKVGVSYYSMYSHIQYLADKEALSNNSDETRKDKVIGKPSLETIPVHSDIVIEQKKDNSIDKKWDYEKYRAPVKHVFTDEVIKDRDMKCVFIGNPIFHDDLGLGKIMKLSTTPNVYITEFETKKGVDKYFTLAQCSYLQNNLLKELRKRGYKIE